MQKQVFGVKRRVAQKKRTKGRRYEVNEWTAPPRAVDRVLGKNNGPKPGCLINFAAVTSGVGRSAAFFKKQMYSKHGEKLGHSKNITGAMRGRIPHINFQKTTSVVPELA